MSCQGIGIVIYLIAAIVLFSSGGAAATFGGILLVVILIAAIFLGLDIWFLIIIDQYRRFLSVRFVHVRNAQTFSRTFTGT